MRLHFTILLFVQWQHSSMNLNLTVLLLLEILDSRRSDFPLQWLLGKLLKSGRSEKDTKFEKIFHLKFDATE